MPGRHAGTATKRGYGTSEVYSTGFGGVKTFHAPLAVWKVFLSVRESFVDDGQPANAATSV